MAAGRLAVITPGPPDRREDFPALVVLKRIEAGLENDLKVIREKIDAEHQRLWTDLFRSIRAKIVLTERESEVLAVLVEAEHPQNKQIAGRLHIAERTVKFHISALLAKFQVNDRYELRRICGAK